MHKKNVIAGGLIALATCAVGLEFYYTRSSAQEAQDRANLQTQTSAAGMPAGTFDPRQMQARMLDDMTRQLGLSPAQTEKMGKIQKGMFPAMDAVMEDKTLSNDQKGERMQRLREDQEKQIRDLLTSEQQSKYDTMQTQFRQRMAQNRGGQPGNPGMPPGGMPMSPGGMAIPPGGPVAGGMPGPPPGGMPPSGMGAPNGGTPGRGN